MRRFDRLAAALDPKGVVREPRQRRSSRLISAAKRTPVFKEWAESGELVGAGTIVSSVGAGNCRLAACPGF